MNTLIIYPITALMLSFGTALFVTNGVDLETKNAQQAAEKPNMSFLIKDVKVTLGDIEDSLVTVDELLKVKSLKIHAPITNLKSPPNYEIESFVLSHFENKTWIDISSSSAEITPEMTKVISQAKQGEKLYFEKILVKYPNNSSRKISSIKVVIK